MKYMEFRQLIDGLDFGEGPRWHDDALWYSDFYQQRVYRVDAAGNRSTVLELDDQPSGLGWLPDGDLLVVAMKSQQILRFDGVALHLHADLSHLAAGLCNDMVVADDGVAYVGCFGFDLMAGESFRPAPLMLVEPDGTARVAAEDLAFPNGCVITPDGKTIIVGQSFSGEYVAFDREPHGSLINRRVWASVPGTAPDGCTLDADGGVWFSDASGSRVIRTMSGGEITNEFETPQPTFACTLGGAEGKTLFVLTAPSAEPAKAAGQGNGAIWTIQVEIAKAGKP